MKKPPLVIHRSSRTVAAPPAPSRPIAPPPPAEPVAAPHDYDKAREERSPLDLAEYILASEGQLSRYRGVEYLDGKVTTPMLKMQAANRVLKSLGLKQIDKNPAWRQ